MSTRLKPAAVVAGCLLVICFLVATVRHAQEPTYNGLTMRQWLTRHSSQAEEALIVLGTNNLPLLVRRVAYDPKKDPAFGVFSRLSLVTRSTRMRAIATRRISLADDAHGVFYRLGPKAAPAIPQLARIVEQGGYDPSQRAMSILVSLGEEGLAVVASRVAHTNAETRGYALSLLAKHTASRVARVALTNALNDPDYRVRLVAKHGISNQLR